MKVSAGIIAFFGLVALVPAAARAHPMLDRAVVAYEEADFERALRTFDMAAANADLSVEELLQLFERRALVHHALGDDDSMRADLERLLAVRASYQLGRLAPPSVRSAFEEARAAAADAGSVELRIEETRIEGELWVVAKVLRVPENLVDHTTLQCSVDNNARTVSRTSQGTTASVKLDGAHNGCAATARTRQGGVLFQSSIDGAIASAPSISRRRFETPKQERRDEGQVKKKKRWPWIVAASAALVVGGVTAGIVISQRSKGSDSPETGAVTVNW
jgi:hypothetical protein